MENYAGAAEDFEAAVKAGLNLADSLTGLGKAKMGLGDYLGAFNAFDEALKNDPGNEMIYSLRNGAFEKQYEQNQGKKGQK